MSDASTIPTPSTPDVCTMTILVDGTETPASLHIQSITVTRETNRIPSASIQVEDGESSKGTFAISSSDQFLPGKTIEIQLGYRSQNETVFKGLIGRQHIKVRKSGSALVVDCWAQVVKATHARRSKVFIDKKDSEIIEEALDAHGLGKDVEATTIKQKQVVQFDSSDWDFLVCRAEANGQVVSVEDDKVRTFKPKATNPALQMVYGSTVLELDAEMDARWQDKGVKAISWSPADQKLAEADGAEPTTSAAGNFTAADLAKAMGDDVEELRHGGTMSEAELQAWADGRLQRMRLARLRGRARCQGFAKLKPGETVQITGIGDRFAGKLFVSGVRHTVAGGNWETDVQFGLSPETFAETYDLKPSPAAGLLPAASGLQIGVVTALEKDPKGEERIRVRLPLVDPKEDGVWARLATFSASKDHGAYFRPEIDDEVVVGFLHQDPDHPVVLGSCNSSARGSAEPGKDDNNKKGWVSREKLKLTFDEDKKVIELETPGGNKLTLSDDAKGIALVDQNGNKLTLDDKGITVESAKDLILKAPRGDVKVSGKNVELTAQTGFKASGASTAEMTGAQTKINGDAMTVIKGGMVQIN